MKYKAVIFDLYGTLIDIFTVGQYDNALQDAADALGIEYARFRRRWDETTWERNTGKFADTREVMADICQAFGIDADDNQIEKAAACRLNFVRDYCKPRKDAVSVIRTLKERGLKIGLLSNCSPEAEELWDEMPFASLFDVIVFSTKAGMKKPDPRIYLFACEQLGMKPEECIFVGDGDGNELTGAAAVGLHPVKIVVDDEPGDAMQNRQEWDGPTVTSLTGLLDLVL